MPQVSSAPYPGPYPGMTPYPGPQGPGQGPYGVPPGQQAVPYGAPPVPYGAPGPAPVPYDAPAAPPAYLDLTVQGTAGWTAWIAPQVYVNGWVLPQRFGRSTVPVPPGHVRVDVVVQWTKKFGRASLDLQMAPGQVVPVFYATPYHVFAKGAIGHVKQRRPGLLGILLPLVVLVGIVVAAAVIGATAGS